MKSMAIIFELMDDEVELVFEALSQTAIRFGGMTADELKAILFARLPEQQEGISATHQLVSDGLLYMGHKPHRWIAEKLGC